MANSGAGLNRVGQRGGVPLLTIRDASTLSAVALPGHGTIGVNDSGPMFFEAIGFSKLTFQLLGTLSGVSVTVLGTIDPAAYAYGEQLKGTNQINQVQFAPAVTVPDSSWFPLPAPSQESSGDAFTWKNPLATAGDMLYLGTPLVAVRVVVTALSTPTGAGTVVAFAIP